MFLSKISKNVQSQTLNNLTFDEVKLFITENDWSPAQFKENYRLKSNFQSACIIGLDIDDGAGLAINRCPTIEEAIVLFKNYKHIIAPTRSHRKDKHGTIRDRYRVLLFLEETVTDSKLYETIVMSLMGSFPFVDINCKDSSRFFYKSSEIASASENGIKISITVSSPVKLASKKKYTIQNSFSSFIENGAPPGDWNNSLLKASMNAKQLGLSIQEAIDDFSSMKNPYFAGVLDEKDLATINSAYKYEMPPLFPITYSDSSGAQKIVYEHPENMKYLISKLLGLNVRFNELKLHIEVDGKKLDDSLLSTLRNQARRHRLKPSGSFVEDCLNEMSLADKYHPFKEFVESRKWEGGDHIEQFFDLLNIPKDDTNYELYLKWFRK